MIHFFSHSSDLLSYDDAATSPPSPFAFRVSLGIVLPGTVYSSVDGDFAEEGKFYVQQGVRIYAEDS